MTSKRKTNSSYEANRAVMDRILKAKHERRVELANLPFPEKVKIVVKLQEINNAWAKAAGRKPGRVWKI